MRRLLSILILGALLLFSAGCGAVLVGGAAAGATYAYVDGQAKATYGASLNTAYSAALTALHDLSIPVVEERKTANDASIKARLSGDTVFISLDSINESSTEITVRVGLMGNKSSSARIHNAIRERL
jgi:outer membrane lipopolysaccharide assembly protein LptE/RlpB